MSQASDLGPVLLLPETMLRLTGPGPRIIELCDGKRSLEEIIATLQSEFTGADVEMIRREVVAFLVSLQEKRALDLV